MYNKQIENKRNSIYRFGVKYVENQVCPACSNEIDKGGRLRMNKRVNCFLKCDRCKYTIKSTNSMMKNYIFLKRKQDKQNGHSS